MPQTTSRLAFLVLGHAFVFLAMVGVFLPILPTTPFVLAASACYAKSSKKFHSLLRNSHWFGPLIENWEREKSISLRAKCAAIAMITFGISISLFLVSLHAVQIGLVVTGALVSLYIATRPSPRKDKNIIAARP